MLAFWMSKIFDWNALATAITIHWTRQRQYLWYIQILVSEPVTYCASVLYIFDNTFTFYSYFYPQFALVKNHFCPRYSRPTKRYQYNFWYSIFLLISPKTIYHILLITYLAAVRVNKKFSYLQWVTIICNF